MGLSSRFSSPKGRGFFPYLSATLSGQPRCAARRRRAVSMLGEGEEQAVLAARLFALSCSEKGAEGLRGKLSAVNNNYLNIQQEILETLVDRGQLQRASSSTIPGNWPSCTLSSALHRSHPPTRSAPAKSIRTSSPPSVALRSSTPRPPFDTTSPSCAPKALVEKLPRSRRYRLPAEGYLVCLFLETLRPRLRSAHRCPPPPDPR
jgi:hypothetical protein